MPPETPQLKDCVKRDQISFPCSLTVTPAFLCFAFSFSVLGKLLLMLKPCVGSELCLRNLVRKVEL